MLVLPAILSLLPILPALAHPAAIEKRDPITQAVYDRLVHYMKFASSAYHSDSCPKPVGAHLVKTFSNKQTDTAGFIARDDTRKEIVIAFRGSNDHKDALTEQQCKLINYKTPGVAWNGGLSKPHTQVHAGFMAAYNSVADTIRHTVADQIAQHNGTRFTIVLVGHDIGGALASLGSVAMRNIFFDNTVNAFSYGQPRTGDLQYAFLVDELMGFFFFRAVHTDDGVPFIFPQSKGYRHHGIEYWQFKDPSSVAHTKLCRDSEFAEDASCSIGLKHHDNGKPHHTYFGINYNTPFCH